MISIEIVNEMVATQIAINDITHADWRTKGLDFRLAITMEAAEGLASEGWAWWKKPPHDVENCRMELIDIWHFKIAASIVNALNDTDAAKYLKDGLWLGGWMPVRPVITNWKHLIVHAFSFRTFNDLCKYYQMDGAMFAKLYFCKAELNILRQLNGYKEGRYLKTWKYEGHLVEDNYAVKRIADNYDLASVDGLAQFRHVMAACYASQGAPGC